MFFDDHRSEVVNYLNAPPEPVVGDILIWWGVLKSSVSIIYVLIYIASL